MTICIRPCAACDDDGMPRSGCGWASWSSSAARSVAVSRSKGSCSYGQRLGSGPGQDWSLREILGDRRRQRLGPVATRCDDENRPEVTATAAAAMAARAETRRSGTTIDWRSSAAIAAATPGFVQEMIDEMRKRHECL